MRPPEAVRVVQVVQGRERAGDDLLGHGEDSLLRFAVCSCTAREPRTDVGRFKMLSMEQR